MEFLEKFLDYSWKFILEKGYKNPVNGFFFLKGPLPEWYKIVDKLSVKRDTSFLYWKTQIERTCLPSYLTTQQHQLSRHNLLVFRKRYSWCNSITYCYVISLNYFSWPLCQYLGDLYVVPCWAVYQHIIDCFSQVRYSSFWKIIKHLHDCVYGSLLFLVMAALFTSSIRVVTRDLNSGLSVQPSHDLLLIPWRLITNLISMARGVSVVMVLARIWLQSSDFWWTALACLRYWNSYNTIRFSWCALIENERNILVAWKM